MQAKKVIFSDLDGTLINNRYSFEDAQEDTDRVAVEDGNDSTVTQLSPKSDNRIAGRQWGEVLEGLIGVIQDRKKTLPEGSYTSYLFTSGTSKIRKKTGEEAVELILAEGKEEVSSEAADLIYHMLVLLEALEIPFDDVVRELENRS